MVSSKNSRKFREVKISGGNFGKGLEQAVKVPIIEQLLNNEIMVHSQKLKNCFRNGLFNKGY